jgi:hypothetical protein
LCGSFGELNPLSHSKIWRTNMENILKALIEGANQQPTGGRAAAPVDPMAEILGGILGGSAGPSSRSPMPSQGQSDPLGGLLEGILGGGRSSAPIPSPQQGDPLGGLLEGILGGGSSSTPAPSSGGIMDILGSVLGGGSKANNPIANLLAEKLGISPVIANMIVSYFMAKLMSGKVGHMIPSGGTGGGISARPVQTQQDDGLDLDDLFDIMDEDESAVRTHLSNSSMPKELAKYADIDENTATKGLEELVKIIGGQRRHPQPVTPQKANLKGLLDNWDVE